MSCFLFLGHLFSAFTMVRGLFPAAVFRAALTSLQADIPKDTY